MDVADRHRWARGVLEQAWGFEFPGDMPDLTELQTLQAQGAHEGWYGFASRPPQWFGSNNWGAVDWTPGSKEDFFVATDTNNKGQVIEVRFKKYATPLDGARDLLHEALTRRWNAAEVVDEGNLLKYSQELREAHYFVAPAADYATALFNHAKDIAEALGEPLAVSLDAPKPSGLPSPSRAGSSLGPVVIVGLGALAWYLWKQKRA